MTWMDISERVGWIGLTVLLAGAAVAAWLENRRNGLDSPTSPVSRAKQTANYQRFLAFLAAVRDAHSSDPQKTQGR